MNIKTGLSIYNKPWLIEPSAAIQMLDFWNKVQGGEQWNYHSAKGEDENKSNERFFALDGVTIAPESTGGMYSFKGFEGSHTAVISISGPLMKNDYCGSLGTASLRQLTQMAAATESIKTILYVIDSPGGTVDGTQSFANAIKSSGKQTIALVDGMMCSAAYWIGSSCDKIYSSNSTDMIGSIGTMCALKDNTEEMKTKGIVLREYYATDSTDKNKMFSDAQKGDGKALISEMLDPMNDMFMEAVKENRYGKLNKSENVLTGKTYMTDAAQAAGLIDGISSIDSIINSNKLSNTSYSTKGKTTKVMNAAEFKAAHPAEYGKIVSEGIAQGIEQERDRVTAALVYVDVDAAGVKKVIADGKPLTQTFFAEMNLAQGKASLLTGLQAGNTTTTTQSVSATTTATTEEQESEAFIAASTEKLLKQRGIK